jgi:hypothetical protein
MPDDGPDNRNVVSFPSKRDVADEATCRAAVRDLIRKARATDDLMRIDGLLHEAELWLDRAEAAGLPP